MPRDSRTTMNVARVVHRLLTDSNGWRVDELCDELGWCGRTFRKHKKRLIEDFEPFSDPHARLRPKVVKDGDHKFFRLVPDPAVTTRQPNLAHKLGTLAWMRQLLSVMDGSAIGESANGWEVQMRGKVRDASIVFGDWLNDLDRMMVYVPHSPRSYRDKVAQLDVVLNALMQRKVVQVWYAGHEQPFQIHPWSLLLHDSAVYLYGERNDEQRMLSVDRIDRVEALETHFEYPSPERYDPASLFAGPFPPQQNPVAVELVVEAQPWLQQDIEDRQWCADGRVQSLPDGRVRVRFETDGAGDVADWLMGAAPYIECVTPTLPEWTNLLHDATNSGRQVVISRLSGQVAS